MYEIIPYIFLIVFVGGPFILMPLYFLFGKGKRVLSLAMILADSGFAYWWLHDLMEVLPENESGFVIVGMIMFVPFAVFIINLLLMVIFHIYQKKHKAI